MSTPSPRRMVHLVATFLAAGALLDGCSAGDEGAREAEMAVQVDSSLPAVQEGTGFTAPDTLVVEMTGLLLVVPQTPPQTGEMHVVLPNESGHAAWFGFGRRSDASYPQGLCEGGQLGERARTAGICYVDLEKWTLGPLGSGGQPPSHADSLPAELVNVTHLSGGEHVVHRSDTTGRRSTVILSTGTPGKTCSLARWNVRRFVLSSGTHTDTSQRLANVLDWKIIGPSRFELVFTSTTGPATHTIPLPPAVAGRIHVVLAHIPRGELHTLPPGWPDEPGDDGGVHFLAYYDHLFKPGNPPQRLPSGNQRRPPPQVLERRPGTACRVGITTTVAVGDTSAFQGQSRGSLQTFGCVLARADGT